MSNETCLERIEKRLIEIERQLKISNGDFDYDCCGCDKSCENQTKLHDF